MPCTALHKLLLHSTYHCTTESSPELFPVHSVCQGHKGVCHSGTNVGTHNDGNSRFKVNDWKKENRNWNKFFLRLKIFKDKHPLFFNEIEIVEIMKNNIPKKFYSIPFFYEKSQLHVKFVIEIDVIETT